jgi:hypothetical protein
VNILGDFDLKKLRPYQKILAKSQNFAQMPKFRPIWSHCLTVRPLLSVMSLYVCLSSTFLSVHPFFCTLSLFFPRSTFLLFLSILSFALSLFFHTFYLSTISVHPPFSPSTFYHRNLKPGVDVMVTIFCDFCQFSAKKMAFFSKTNDIIQFLHNLALF